MKKLSLYLLATVVLAVVCITCKAQEERPSANFTIEEQQKINIIKDRYLRIQTDFSGGYFVKVPTTSPYSAGEVKNEVLQAGIDAVNVVRFIAGVPDDVELCAEYVDLTQHGAVLLSAVNQLTHNPSRPAGMSDAFYQKGKTAASSSNISTVNLPSATVFRYMDDSDPGNINRVGHRRWILNPSMKKTGFGVGANRYGLMYAFDKSRGDVDYTYVAWPSPGVFPAEFAKNNLAWSISVNEQKYGKPVRNQIKVTLKHVQSGRVWAFSNNATYSTARQSAYFNVDTGGYGVSNCIIFRPAWDDSFQYQEGDEFQVTVSGFEKEINYTVKMFHIN